MPFAVAIFLAIINDSSGVGGMFFNRYMGQNLEKCTGTSGPRFSIIQSQYLEKSSFVSLYVGTIRFTISSHTPFSFINFIVFITGPILALVRSEEHTSELQSQFHLVCRLLLEKK